MLAIASLLLAPDVSVPFVVAAPLGGGTPFEPLRLTAAIEGGRTVEPVPAELEEGLPAEKAEPTPDTALGTDAPEEPAPAAAEVPAALDPAPAAPVAPTAPAPATPAIAPAPSEAAVKAPAATAVPVVTRSPPVKAGDPPITAPNNFGICQQHIM